MHRFRVFGLILAICSAGALLATPALAAGTVTVPLQYDAATLQMPGNDLTNNGQVPTPALNPCRQGGGTFADTSVNATGFPAGKAYTPSGSPVAFQMPASATGDNALCLGNGVTGKGSATINVPKGNYTDAYFLAAIGNGPGLVDVTPMYGSTKGTIIKAVFPDWCQTTPQVGNQDPTNVSAGWNGGPRVQYSGSVSGESKLPCGYYTVHVPGLNNGSQLTAIELSLEPVGTAIPDSESGAKGATQQTNAVLNIMALTLKGTAVPGAAATLPKTGGSPLGQWIGLGLLAAGLALVWRPRFARSGR